LQPDRPARVALVNNTGAGYDVTVTTVWADGTAVMAPGTPTVRLEPGGVATASVAVPDSVGVAGFIVAVARPAGGPVVVARRPFRVDASKPAWAPLVADWRVTSGRWPVHGMHNTAVPLADGETCGDPTVSAVVGGVARTGGGSAVVTATCRAGAKRVELSFDGLDRTGDYTGKVDLAPDTDGGDLALTVRHTDGLLYPAMLLLAGILLAVLAAWQSGRLSALSRAREEAWLLQAQAAAVQQRFWSAGEGRTWQPYSFLAALISELDQVRARLGAQRWLFSEIAADKGPYKAELDKLTELQKLVTAWESFAPQLAALAQARDLAKATPIPAAILTHADDLLDPEAPVLAIARVQPLVEDVGATLPAVRAWPDDARAVRELRALGRTLAGLVPPGPDRERLDTANNAVEVVHNDLVTAADGAAYSGLNVAARLKEPKVVLSALQRRYGLVAAGVAREPVDITLPAPPEVPRMLRDVQESAAATARRIVLSRRLRNGLAFLAIAAVTAWTGLTALYFDRAFGTWRDYVAVAVWGFGAQAGLAVLIGALDKVIASGKVVRP
jgi:hypothetical protein